MIVEHSNISMVVVFPDGIVAVPEAFMPEDTPMHEVINAQVGGHFDSVYPMRREQKFVGYVNDEGLLLGLEPNALASAIFGRFLCGPCVIIGTVNEHGEETGEDYNLLRNDYELIMRVAQPMLMWRDTIDQQKQVEELKG
jgi:hypothetical protein